MQIGTEVVRECCQRIIRAAASKPQAANIQFAASYAKTCIQQIISNQPLPIIKTQVLYVLANLSGWRGDEAKLCKQTLKDFAA